MSQFLVETSTRIMQQCNIIKHCLNVWNYVNIKRSATANFSHELRPRLGRCCQWTRHDDSNFIPFPSCLFFRGYKYSISCPCHGVLRITGENSTIFITACFQPISIKGVFAERYSPTLNYGHLKHNGIMGL